jgi:hypothetical protein
LLEMAERALLRSAGRQQLRQERMVDFDDESAFGL